MTLWYLLAAVCLPLFPASMLFTRLYAGCPNVLLRSVLLIVWPQLGVYALGQLEAVPGWLAGWALASSALYAFRALTLNEAGHFTAYLSASLGALLWLAPAPALALAWALPLVLMAFATGQITTRFGAAYAGYPGGLAQRTPRLAGVFALSVLAAAGTPPASAFAVWLALLFETAPAEKMALLGIWLVWSWAVIRLLQGLLVGEARSSGAADLSRGGVAAYAVALAVLAGFGGLILGGFA